MSDSDKCYEEKARVMGIGNALFGRMMIALLPECQRNSLIS